MGYECEVLMTDSHDCKDNRRDSKRAMTARGPRQQKGRDSKRAATTTGLRSALGLMLPTAVSPR